MPSGVHSNHARGSASGAAVLTESKVRTIRRLVQAGWTDRQLAERYGVTPNNITAIRLGHTWKHVEAGR